jgi:DNA-binding transcriptional LysR family regulator/predicted transcriptional regulator
MLTALETVATAGSYEGATAEAGSRGTVSNALRALEGHINRLEIPGNPPPIRLTTRVDGSHRVTLSPAGQALVGPATDFLVAFTTFRNICGRVRSGRTHFVVGCLPEHAASLALASRTLIDTGVPVQLMVRESSSALRGTDMVEAVVRGELDLAVVPEQPLPEGLVSQTLYSWSLRCVVSPNHRLVGKSSCDLSDLAAERVLVSPMGHASRAMIDAIGVVGVGFESDSADALVALARSGWGAALVPDDSLALRNHDPLHDWPVVHHAGHPIQGRVIAVVRESGLGENYLLASLINDLRAIYTEDESRGRKSRVQPAATVEPDSQTHRFLKAVVANPGRTSTEVMRDSNIASDAMVSRVGRRLEEDQMVRRLRSGRNTQWYPTPQGKAVMENLEASRPTGAFSEMPLPSPPH